MEDWAEIRRLHKAEQMGVKATARKLGIARNTVRSALRSDSPPKYERVSQGSIVDAVEPEIRELLRDTPDMPATGSKQQSFRHGRPSKNSTSTINGH